MYKRLYNEFHIIINISDYFRVLQELFIIRMERIESQIRIFEWQCAYLNTKTFPMDLEDSLSNTV